MLLFEVNIECRTHSGVPPVVLLVGVDRILKNCDKLQYNGEMSETAAGYGSFAHWFDHACADAISQTDNDTAMIICLPILMDMPLA